MKRNMLLVLVLGITLLATPLTTTATATLPMCLCSQLYAVLSISKHHRKYRDDGRITVLYC